MAEFSQRDLIRRTNMLYRKADKWRPLPFAPSRGRWASAQVAIRPFVDLQAGSIWRDLKNVLPHVTGTILDVGCGAQPYRTLVPATARYIGIDSIAGKDHFGDNIPDTRYFSGDHGPIDDGSVDIVLCTEVSEHVPGPQQFLTEAFRCPIPGGKILLTVPFAARWHFIPDDYRRLAPSGLGRLLSEAGFANTRVYACGNAFTVACYKAIALLLLVIAPRTQTILLRLMLRILSVPFVPALILLAMLANCSLLGEGGDDRLGYTAISERKPT